VKSATNGLVRALSEVEKFGGQAVLVVNPEMGYFKDRIDLVRNLFLGELKTNEGLSAGIRIGPSNSLDTVAALCRTLSDRQVTILHCGYPDGKGAAKVLDGLNIARHVFLEESCSKLYRKHFKSSNRVLIRDGFTRRTNREHPALERFSDLHVTFDDEGMTGFGDFLIVGDDYQESGGPAYAVAIHVTYIDPDRDDEMFVLHFVSIRTDTIQDPAGKFGEALAKLVDVFQRPDSHIASTKAIKEFVELHRQGHFPGLGYVKKLSMQHHIETLALFLGGRGHSEP
jgi:hypothetical protein